MFPHQVFSYTPVVDPSKIDESKNPVWNPGPRTGTSRARIDGRMGRKEQNISMGSLQGMLDWFGVFNERLWSIEMWVWIYVVFELRTKLDLRHTEYYRILCFYVVFSRIY